MRPPNLSFAACRGALAGGRAGHVAVNHDRLAAACAYLVGDRLDRRSVAPDQRELAAFSGERLAHRGAHPLGRSGDHRDAALQSQVH